MQFNISFKTIFEYILKKLVLCIQIRFVSTEKTTRIASRASCLMLLLYFTAYYSRYRYFELLDSTNPSTQGRMQDFSRGGATLKFFGFWVYMSRAAKLRVVTRGVWGHAPPKKFF